ncbi:ScbR family autoregulator-binding transcription factor [Streptomyces sp. G-G2]|uniref:ScbR family autoregulator-binding transcription factor n=1 Tax=Streptomyces sp. G-G2 TaxID=3046201 RepID=UPI0024BBE091|nr:ScbR family autoregulator-binding transcription factor [Streptomyces sp. G-G2]MDJ0386145.1 ScbR family autoregulator-binding transcription factor [Streptomyces sp. G-G2]
MQERSERTRRRLVGAGAELFHRNGYANATLGDIAGAAGVTKGALYFHFASKDELAEAVQQRGCALLHDSVRALREAGASPLQSLIDTTHWMARTLHEDPAIPASFRITKECAGQQPPVIDFHRAWIIAVCTLLRQARDAGELRADHRWESTESLVAAAASGIEVMSGTGMPYGELQRKVAALWVLLLPAVVAAGREGEYRTRAAGPLWAGGVGVGVGVDRDAGEGDGVGPSSGSGSGSGSVSGSGRGIIGILGSGV